MKLSIYGYHTSVNGATTAISNQLARKDPRPPMRPALRVSPLVRYTYGQSLPARRAVGKVYTQQRRWAQRPVVHLRPVRHGKRVGETYAHGGQAYCAFPRGLASLSSHAGWQNSARRTRPEYRRIVSVDRPARQVPTTSDNARRTSRIGSSVLKNVVTVAWGWSSALSEPRRAVVRCSGSTGMPDQERFNWGGARPLETRCPHPVAWSQRLRFYPATISTPWMLRFGSPRNRSLCKPCHCFASPNSGSTQTLRFRIACSKAGVVWYERTRST
jgi:hypothetical protein